MAKVCLRTKRNRRIGAFVLPLALAAALVVSGCGAKTDNNGGGTEAVSGTGSQENGSGEDGKDVFVEELGESAVVLGILCIVPVLKYNIVRRELNEKIILEFRKHGIEIPYNQLDVHITEKK